MRPAILGFTVLVLFLGSIADRESESQEEGTIQVPDVGFSISYPSSWTGTDSTLSATDIHYKNGQDWIGQVFARSPQPGPISPYLVVKVISPTSPSGEQAMVDYFAALSKLGDGESKLLYDLTSNTEMLVSQVGPTTSIELETSLPPGRATEPHATHSVCLLLKGNLIMVAYTHGTIEEIHADEDIWRPIFESIGVQP